MKAQKNALHIRGDCTGNFRNYLNKNRRKEQEMKKKVSFAILFITILFAAACGKKEDFTYLYSEKPGIYIPKDADYCTVDEELIYGGKLGVTFKFIINPDSSDESKDDSLSDSLQYYLESTYDEYYSTAYNDLSLSEVQKLANGVRATANYCVYDRFTDSYSSVYCTYFLTELSKKQKLLVSIEINPDRVTQETEMLLAELEECYGFLVDWDAEAAREKLEHFLANGAKNRVTESTGYFLFELPAGFKRDYGYGSDHGYAYAPDGDASGAGCVISIERTEMGRNKFDASELFLDDLVDTKAYFIEQYEDIIYNLSVTDYGPTVLGNAVFVSYDLKYKDYSYTDHNFLDYEERWEWYFITEGEYFYVITAAAVPDCTEDVFAVTEDILQNGRVRE